MLNEGQTVTLIGTDNKEWCLVETSTGKKGWFKIKDNDIIDSLNISASKVFSGLCYAD